MPVEINIEYQGQLRCVAQHGPSGVTLGTDAPKDNHGRGELFSPTDLVATALGSCMMTIMGIYADRLGVDLKGARCRVRKHMSSAPRRIGVIELIFTMPTGIEAAVRRKLEQAAETCPVHRSVHPDVQLELRFEWDGA